MPWVTFVPILLLAAVIFLGPGLLVMRAAGVRGLPLFAVSGPTTVTVAGAVAVAAPYAGIRYGIIPVAACALILTVAALVLRYVLAMRGLVFGAQPRKSFSKSAENNAATEPALTPAQEWVRRGAIIAAFAIPAVIITVRFAGIIGAPGNISQTYDNIFHLNAVGYILITGSGSSLTLGNLTEASAAFYPAAWHDLIALVASTASVSVPEAISAGNIVIAAIMWPLGMMYLISRISSGHVLPMLLTGALAAGFSSFPYLMIDFGVLYPNLLAIAIMPVALALTIDLLGLNPTKRRIVPVLCQGALILPGLALAHPSFVVALFGLALPLLLTKLVRLVVGFRRSEATGRQLVGFAVLTAVFIPLVFIVWDMASQSLTSSRWKPYQTVSQAIGEVLGAGPQGRHVSLVMFVMLVAGLVASIARRKLVWALGMAFVAAGLFIVASALPPSETRHFLTGVWYNDSHRLAAMLPVVLLPLAVLGGESILRGTAAAATRHRVGETASRILRLPRAAALDKIAPAAVLLVGVFAIAVGAQFGTVGKEQVLASANYSTGPHAPLVSTDERALLDRLPSHVPAEASVYGDPWTGASLTQGLSLRRSVSPHIVGRRTPEELVIMSKIDEAGVDPVVCPAVKSLDVQYALIFDDKEVHGGAHPNTAMDKADTAPGLKLVDQEGPARLYQVTGCGPLSNQ
ncbi:DUF6541 family protein [Arthrobacter sp. D1-17]